MMYFISVPLSIYLALIVLLYTNQRRLIYLPDPNIASPYQYGLEGFSDDFITTDDNIRIQIWYRKAVPNFPTIVYCHGNAAHIGNRAGILSALAEKGFGVLGISYRGYGKSQGTPSEQGLYQDGRAAMRFLIQTQNISPSHIILYGESLGTGVATQIANEYAVGMLVLQAPYTSLAQRAAELYYYVPVHMLIKDRFDSIDKIDKVNAPLLLFHGELDPTIPVAHGKAMFEKAKSVKQAFFLPNTSHNDFDSGFISSHVLRFAREQRLITP